MPAVAQAHRLGKQDLEDIAAGNRCEKIDDMEFLETLAHKHCMIMPPWIYHLSTDGKLEKLTPVRYTQEYDLDKASILLGVMRRLHEPQPVH